MEKIIVTDAFENNLKHINVEIPINKFTCVIGNSGSGKSSLVFDTIYAESQRAFLEGTSGIQFGQKLMKKPNVGSVSNLRPSMNISQNYYNVNPRSTVGTVTDISYYLRALFAFLCSNDCTISENDFSSNNPNSFCINCQGLGVETIVAENLLIPDKEKKLNDGAILLYKGTSEGKEKKEIQALCDYYNIDINKKVSELTKEEYYNLMFSEESIKIKLNYKVGKRKKQYCVFLKGAIKTIEEKTKKIRDNNGPLSPYEQYLEQVPCHICKGFKLNNKILMYTVCGLNYSQVENMELYALLEWVNILINKVPENKRKDASQMIDSIKIKIKSLINLNLGYLSLSRSIPSLSGGERQRVRIALQLYCPLKDIIYILDEPCKGLHYRDVKSIVDATVDLVNRGNTVIAIEHNPLFIKAADNTIELGPIGGPKGGYVISTDKWKNPTHTHPPFKTITVPNDMLIIDNINYRNLHNEKVKIPIGMISFITGVSGSGKTSLVQFILECIRFKNNIEWNGSHSFEKLKKVYEVNQMPIGKNPHSTIMSYLNISDHIRNVFASTPEAKKNKITSSMFSMSISGGRCECCSGTGFQKMELNFLPSTYIPCPVCNGKRFADNVLSIKYKNHSINDILDSPISNIIDAFVDNKIIYNTLSILKMMGLDYIKLGQMSMNLSGGEAQRIKLARALSESSIINSMIILDEPSSGLSVDDILKIENVLNMLKSKNNTILIIDHNIDFIVKTADYIIDLGTKCGNNGGHIVYQGEPRAAFDTINSSLFGLIDNV